MDRLIIVIKLIIAISVLYVWTFRMHNVIKDFKQFGLPNILRNIVGTSKITIANILIVSIWIPELTTISALFMSLFMLIAQYFHNKVKNHMLKRFPSLILLLLNIVLIYLVN